MRETEMEADDLRMKLHNKIAHFVVKGSASGVWNRGIVISLQLAVIGVQASSPVHLPGWVVSRRLVTEEVCIDGTRGLSPDGFKFLACLFHAQKRTSKRTETSSL